MNSAVPHRLILAAALLAPLASAQVLPIPENVLQLAASAAVEVTQDVLALHLHATREGSDPVRVQGELKSVLDQALTEVRRSSQPGAMDVRTGNFSVGPRYGREGRITGWVGTAELVLEGSDFTRISQAAGRIPAMTLAHAGFRLSREKREAAEREAQGQAVASFRARAAELTKAFGFTSYSLREVAVQGQDQGMPRPRMAAMEMRAAAAPDAPVPVEAGRSSVVVNVTGSVQLR